MRKLFKTKGDAYIMLTEKKRRKLLAGTVAAIMVVGAATSGCYREEEPIRFQNGNLAEKNDEYFSGNGGGFWSGFWPWFWIGRLTGSGSGVYYNSARYAPLLQKRISEGWRPGKPKGNLGEMSDRNTGSSGVATAGSGVVSPVVRSGNGDGVRRFSLGKVGSIGKSGIGSGASRSSAVS